MVGDPLISSIDHWTFTDFLHKKKKKKKKNEKLCRLEVTNISPFLLSFDWSFLRIWTGKANMFSFSRPFQPQGTTSSAANVYSLIYLVVLNWVRSQKSFKTYVPQYTLFPKRARWLPILPLLFGKSWPLSHYMASFKKLCAREHLWREFCYVHIYLKVYNPSTLFARAWLV